MTNGSPDRPKPKRSAALTTLIVFVCIFLIGVLAMLGGFFFGISIAYTVGGLLILLGIIGSVISAIVLAFVLMVRSSTSSSSISQPGGGTVSAAPGWYPDPQNPSLLRHFDGRVWTESTRPR